MMSHESSEKIILARVLQEKLIILSVVTENTQPEIFYIDYGEK